MSTILNNSKQKKRGRPRGSLNPPPKPGGTTTTTSSAEPRRTSLVRRRKPSVSGNGTQTKNPNRGAAKGNISKIYEATQTLGHAQALTAAIKNKAVARLGALSRQVQDYEQDYDDLLALVAQREATESNQSATANNVAELEAFFEDKDVADGDTMASGTEKRHGTLASGAGGDGPADLEDEASETSGSISDDAESGSDEGGSDASSGSPGSKREAGASSSAQTSSKRQKTATDATDIAERMDHIKQEHTSIKTSLQATGKMIRKHQKQMRSIVHTLNDLDGRMAHFHLSNEIHLQHRNTEALKQVMCNPNVNVSMPMITHPLQLSFSEGKKPAAARPKKKPKPGEQADAKK